MLLRHLPRESNYVQAVGGERARWGDTEHLLAGIFDVVQVGNYYTQVLASNHQFKDAPKPPKPFPRPGDNAVDVKPKRTTKHTQAEIKSMLDNWNDPPTEEVSDGS